MPRQATQETASESVAPTTTSTVNLRIPRFWKENPAIWFAQLEAQFENHNVVNESSKYFAVLPELEPEVLSQVTDIILQQPRDAYSKIKQRLIDHFSISEEKRIKTLLNELPIGDKKPSFLLREMRNLANDGVKDEFLRTMWIQRLPTQAQAILATSSEPLDILAVMADKIVDISSSSSSIAAVQSSNEISELRQQISALTNAVKDLQIPKNRRSRSKSHSRSRKPRNSSQQICYYHRKFGDYARCCRQPCSYSTRNSENSQGGHYTQLVTEAKQQTVYLFSTLKFRKVF